MYVNKKRDEITELGIPKCKKETRNILAKRSLQ